jgi:bromodomain-containing protein 7
MNDSLFSPNHQSQPKSTRSGLTLVLPPLTSGKLKKGHSKPKATLNQHDLVPVDIKVPRPVKLKPLKEVLSRLITLIKKFKAFLFYLSWSY